MYNYRSIIAIKESILSLMTVTV